MEELLTGLNPVQRAAASCTEGAELIIAGAGSGKTRVLTTRIAVLLSRGVPAYRILALTFTKKAAGEMRQRVVQSQGDDAKRVCMGTFHSVFARLLRPYAEMLGYPETFTILDEEGSLSCVKDAVNEVVFPGMEKPKKDDTGDAAKRYRYLEKKYKPKSMLTRISLAKNDGITSSDYARMDDAVDADEMEGIGLFKDIFAVYERKCRKMGVMDFDDILVNMDRLLDTNPLDIINRFDYIMVDEYQDTNRIQYSILRKLTRHTGNICVVGDDSQSIYAFRGAKIQNIFNFKTDFPDASVYKLEQNYRSTQTIVDAANRLIEHNGGRIPKVCFSAGDRGEAIRYSEHGTERDEAAFVADTIVNEVRRHGRSWPDFAVLYRTNAQSRAIENALIRKQVPYIIYSGTSFFDRMEVKDLLAYLKLAVNPRDDESFKRICNKPARGISPKTVDLLTHVAEDLGQSLLDTCSRGDLVELGFPQKVADSLVSFVTLMDELWEMAMMYDAVTAVKLIAMRSGLVELFASDDSEEGKKRLENIREMIAGVASFAEEYKEENPDHSGDVYVTHYIENVMLLSNADTEGRNGDCVSVMTAHCAKGLEFDTVFVTGMEDGLFPLHSDTNTREEREEERRLFYVAVTRAKRVLHITRALSRMQWGSRSESDGSPFITELLPDDSEEDIF